MSNFGITPAILRTVLSRDLGVSEANIEVVSFSLAPGTKKGDGFACEMMAVEVEYRLEEADISGKRNYMAKVLPENQSRAEALKKVGWS